MTKVNPNNRNEAKSDIFNHGTYLNLTSYIFLLKK